MTRNCARLALLLAAVLSLAACTCCAGRYDPNVQAKDRPYGYWNYVQTSLDEFWWTEVVRLAQARKEAGDGSGTTVAIVGTGILRPHEDLATVDPGEVTCDSATDTIDENGHGTQLAGIVAGRDPGHATRGMAPGATLIPIRVDCGATSAASLTKGVDAAIARNPDVILIAIGGYPGGDPEVPTFLLNRVSGRPDILFVIASAWDGTYFKFPDWTKPDNALVVAAMTLDADEKDARTLAAPRVEIPYTTRRGDIWAPGREIATADIEYQTILWLGHSQFLMHGTSPAAAIVAGCAALVKKHTGASGKDLKDRLVKKSDNVQNLGPRLNCFKAVS